MVFHRSSHWCKFLLVDCRRRRLRVPGQTAVASKIRYLVSGPLIQSVSSTLFPGALAMPSDHSFTLHDFTFQQFDFSEFWSLESLDIQDQDIESRSFTEAYQIELKTFHRP